MMNWWDYLDILANGLMTLLAFYFSFRAGRIHNVAVEHYEKVQSLNRRLGTLESDFNDKWDHTMTKIASREYQREKREEKKQAKNLNTEEQKGGIYRGPIERI